MICCPVCLECPAPRERPRTVACRCRRFVCELRESGLHVWVFYFTVRRTVYLHMLGPALHSTSGEWTWSRIDERNRDAFVREAIDDLLARLILES